MSTDNVVGAILEALNTLFQPDQVTELRALEVSHRSYRRPHTVSGYFDDFQKLAEEAAKVSAFAKGVYIVPNPVNPALLARSVNRIRAIGASEPTTSDTDVMGRRWLLIDADPVRPAGISSSEVEHDAALERAREIEAMLELEGWPLPILADSGNGAHLLYRIDLPCNDDNLVKTILEALAFRFDDKAVTIDLKVFNPARIWKLYGTTARKGDNTPERPHRVARLIEVPRLKVVGKDLLQALASKLPKPEPTPIRSFKGEAFNIDRYITEHNLNVTGPYPWQSGRKWIFRVCPWDDNHRNRSAWLIQQSSGAIAAGCQHNGCSDNDWHALRDLVEPGWQSKAPSGNGKHHEHETPLKAFVVESEAATPMHLAQSARSELVGNRVEVPILCAGKLDAPYIVPRKVRYICYAGEKDRIACGAVADDERTAGHWERELDDKSNVFIELCHKRNEQLGRVLKKAAGCQGNCRKFGYEIMEHVNVEQILAVPMAERVLPTIKETGSSRESKDLDESGNEYVARSLFLLDDKATVNQYYRIVGRVYPHPETQLGTILITDQEPMEDNIEQFKLTDELREAFKVFQVEITKDKDDLIRHMNKLILDLTVNVTRIYERDNPLIAILLAYHSVLNFEFEGRVIRRGWLEVLLLGDTGQGKTELTRSIMEFCGLGQLASGETARRTGLCYSVQQIGDRWFVKWGVYVLNDRRLLAIDELSELPPEDLGRMTQGRNDGVMRVEQAGVGEANCRTRLIWMSNPQHGKQLEAFSHGVESLKNLFPAPADLRRLDLAVFLAEKDIDPAELNKIRPTPQSQLISSSALKHSILWAWSRKAGDIVIDGDATEKLLALAAKMSRIYSAAGDVPLVTAADMRNKLARMCVALAAFVHSTDGAHEKVIVKPIHVEFIENYLNSLYTDRNCRYHLYASYAAKKSTLDEAEVKVITEELRMLDRNLTDGDESGIADELLTIYRRHDVLRASELGDLLNLDRRTVGKRIHILQRHELITRGQYGYRKTPKFIEYLNWEDNKQETDKEDGND